MKKYFKIMNQSIIGMTVLLFLSGCGDSGKSGESSTVIEKASQLNIAEQVEAEIIPKEGQATNYGISLSLKNTDQFINYYNNVILTEKEEVIKNEALLVIPAPCCPDNPMSTCCCPCNLAKSVWGLSGYLIREKGYNAQQVRESALQWLHFIRKGYYIKEELKKRGVELSSVGLTPEKSSCYTRICSFPFKDGGCGGM